MVAEGGDKNTITQTLPCFIFTILEGFIQIDKFSCVFKVLEAK